MSGHDDHDDELPYDPDYPPKREGPAGPVKLDEYFAPVISKLWRHYEDPAYLEKLRRLDAQQQAADAARERRDRLPRLKRCGVPEDIAEVIAAGAVDETLPCVRVLRDTSEPALILSGGTGVGKSFAASLWVDEAGDRGRFVSAPQIASLTRSRIDRGKFEELCKLTALAIDDLSTETDDDRGSFRSRFDRLMNRRMAARLRTVVTTNLSALEFQHPTHGYGERLWSRLHQYGRFEHVQGVDLRQQRYRRRR